ncbi:ATP-binding protein [Nocardia brasiliensis]|uniref:Transcriptional regulator, LuxR family protein n=1 Tax=Nocardia brasiliensis (strain ATCC 700358 / HUJEG-1) TaxID=1133849 RepID=K0EXI1_NOCB7|nr:LuxR C-terminal-related transcriptional regulator [Nocardia brasiliensis]AFU04593.1 transcriptional regulator, LuxR family protein [Nocardia brasiliensis ATCC 700358]
MPSSTNLQWPAAGLGLITDDDADIDSVRLPGLVGRDKEVNEIRCLMNDPRVRLLTLTGPAGVGKSRVAQEALALSEFRTATATTVDLAEASNRREVWREVHAAFGFGSGDNESADAERILASLEADLGPDRTILLLDNCDLVSGSIARDVSRLLQRCPNLLVVATSRVVLNLQREYVVSVRPLRTRSESGPYRPASSAAAQLLLASIDSRYRSSAANRLVLDEIAHELDGVPLALELAAITINRIGSAQTLKLIRSGEGLTPLPFVDIPLRHRSLHDAVAWGIDRLDESTVDVLLHLSLCESAVDPDTVSLMVDLEETFIGGTLTTLIGHSLLQRTVTDAGHPSYELIATVRAYCHRLLRTDRVRGDRIRRNHADRLCELAFRLADELGRPDRRAAALQLAEQRVRDFRATVARLIELGRAERAVEVAALLEDVWVHSGCLPELERTLLRFLDTPAGRPEATDPAVPRAMELLGDWALRSGRSGRAVDLFTRAAAAYHRAADDAGAYRATVRLGAAQLVAGQPAQAREQLMRALRKPNKGGERELAEIYLEVLALGDPIGQRDEDWATIQHRVQRLGSDADRMRMLNALANTQLGADTAHRALELFRSALRIPRSGQHVLETLVAVEGCASAYRMADAEFGESAAMLFGAVHHLRNAYAIPLPDDIGSENARAAHLIRPETAGNLRDIVDRALSGPAIPAGSGSPLASLTKRQREIALLVADGMTNRMIASQLGIAEWTVINHLRLVMSKLECPSRLHVALVVKGEQDPHAMAGHS